MYVQKSNKQSKPRQNDFLVWCKWGELIKRVEFDRGRMAEGLGTKVELTLLVGHETGCSKEARSNRKWIKSSCLESSVNTSLNVLSCYGGCDICLRGRGEHLLLRRQLVSVQIEDHLLLTEVQQEAYGITYEAQSTMLTKHCRTQW